MTYKLLSYRSTDGWPRAGILVGDRVFDVTELTGRTHYQSMLAILNDWSDAEAIIERAAKSASGGQPLSSISLLAPLASPGAIYCAGANFTDHMEEMAKVMNMAPEPDPHERGLKPWHFVKPARGSIRGPGETIMMPAYSSMIDWEIELAAVIGTPAKDVSEADALDYVAGYTIANDLSARDFVKREGVPDSSPFKWDWVSQKCFDGACPLGPWITPASQFPHPQKVALKLWVGDELMQDSHTSKMIFTLAEQVSHLSSRITLFPGDLILTGTCAGVGMARKRFLKVGETVRLWIEGIGEMSHRMA
ncbi:MAG: fumarylacetoacetate hydrolase family protein [Burkholderiales bacterium]